MFRKLKISFNSTNLKEEEFKNKNNTIIKKKKNQYLLYEENW